MTNPNVSMPWYFKSFQVTPGGLGLARITISLGILFFLIPGDGVDHYRFLAALPAEFYAPPPGPMQLLNQFPPLSVFLLLHSIILLSSVAMLAGFKTKWSSLICGFSMLVLQGILFSVGKIDHEILVPLVPILMAFSNWGAAWSADALRGGTSRSVESWPLALIALLIGFMMFTAGFPKLLGGWLDPSTQAAQSHLLNQFYGRERQALLAPIAAGLHAPLLWELFDWLTVFFELFFIASLFRPALFRIFIGLAVLFHAGIMLTMNIAFLPNFIAYALFLNWTHLNQKGILLLNSRVQLEKFSTEWVFPAVIIVMLSLIFSLLKWVDSGSLYQGSGDLLFQEIAIVGAAALWVTGQTLISVARHFINHFPKPKTV